MSASESEPLDVESHHAVAAPNQDSGVQRVDMDTVRERIENHREVFVITGLTGSGKSTVASIIEEEHDEKVAAFEMSDFVRAKYEAEEDGYVDDNGLGAWSQARKQEDGRGVFARQLAETIKTPTTPHVAISGVRSPEEAEAIEAVFGDVTTVAVWTLPDIRFNRKYGESAMADAEKVQEFQERNERELHTWDGVSFFTRTSEHEADYIIPNHDSLSDLREAVTKFLNGIGQYDTNPFPHNDVEHVAQYL